MQNERSIDLPTYNIPAGLMIGPRSFRTDRIIPAPEILQLREAATGSGELTLELGQFEFSPPEKSRLRRRFSALFQDEEYSLPDNKLALDLRLRQPDNWAHFLNDHLALVSIILETFDLKIEDIFAILPKDIPGYITDVCRLCSLEFICTDAIVSAQGIKIGIESFNDIRGTRVKWLQNELTSPVAKFLKAQDLGTEACDQRYYLSRRKTRNLRNDDDVTSMLEGLGFKRVFMEDLNVEEQLTLIMKSEVIVGIHGAALAPLAYKHNATSRTKLIEIFPVGHVNNNFRCFAAQIGAQWIGVLGRTEKKNIPYIYDLSKPYLIHSLSSFDVDVDSIRIALENMEETRSAEMSHEG